MSRSNALVRKLVMALTLIGSATAPAVGRATVMVPLSIEDMAKQADCVVRGRVLDSRAAWDAGHERIYTLTEIEVLERMHARGSVPARLTVRTLGGEVGEIGMRVSGTERFALNEEVVLFLRTDPSEASNYQVIGMSQGKLHVEYEAKGRAVAVPSLEGLAFVRPDGSGTFKVSPDMPRADRLPLTELRLRVSAAVTPGSPPGTNGLTPPPATRSPAPTPGGSGADPSRQGAR